MHTCAVKLEVRESCHSGTLYPGSRLEWIAQNQIRRYPNPHKKANNSRGYSRLTRALFSGLISAILGANQCYYRPTGVLKLADLILRYPFKA